MRFNLARRLESPSCFQLTYAAISFKDIPVFFKHSTSSMQLISSWEKRRSPPGERFKLGNNPISS